MASSTNVEWGVWSNIPDVKLWEAVALSLNLDPRCVKVNRNSWMVGTSVIDESPEFSARLLVAERNLTSQKLRPRAFIISQPRQCDVSLHEFSVWAISVGWNLPPELMEIAERTDVPKAQESLAVEKSLGTKERNTIARIIAALAAIADLDLSQPHKAAQVIENQTQTLGIRVSNDTIVKWLKEATAQRESNQK